MEKIAEQTWPDLERNLVAATENGLQIQLLCNEIMKTVMAAISGERNLDAKTNF